MSRRALWLSGAATLVIGGVLLVLDERLWDAGGPGIVGFELAATRSGAERILTEWGAEGRDAARLSLWLDFAYLVSYAAFVALAAARVRAWRPSATWRAAGRAATVAAPLAAVLDIGENLMLLLVLGGHGGAVTPALAALLAAGKFALIGFALGYVVLGLVLRWPRVAAGVVAAVGVVVVVSLVEAGRSTEGASGPTVAGLHVLDEGSGPPLVLVHGLAVSSRWWDPVVPRLARRFRVIRIDLLGHGRSPKPRTGYAMTAQADRVAALLRRLGVRRAAVVGHSMGGAVATALAERHRPLVGRLMVVGTGPGRGSLGVSPALLPVAGPLIRLYGSRRFQRWALEQTVRPEVDLSAAQVAGHDAQTWPAFSGSARELGRYVDARPIASRLRRARMPVTALFGSGDGQRDEASRYRRVPGSRLVVIDGAGHSPMLDAPGATAAVIERFATR